MRNRLVSQDQLRAENSPTPRSFLTEFAALVLFLLCFGSALHSQLNPRSPKYRLEGRVINSLTEEPISRALVVIEPTQVAMEGLHLTSFVCESQDAFSRNIRGFI
jgi:hypothetical protein